MAIEPKPFNVRCARCHHAWTLAMLPMEVMALGEICEQATCPSCGKKEIYVDSDDLIHPAPPG